MSIRITVTLDEDVAAVLQKLRRARGETMKDTVNSALRKGLVDAMSDAKLDPFKTRIVSLGRLRIPSLDNVNDSLACAEDDSLPQSSSTRTP